MPGDLPPEGTPEHAKALAVAAKIMAMASDPVDELVRKMKLMGFGSDHRRIVLEQMARRAMAEACRS